MSMDLRLGQRLDLSLKLAPQIIQSIELLQLAALDLQEMIQQELDTNEFLEAVPKPEPSLSEAKTETPENDETRPVDADYAEWHEMGSQRRSSGDDEASTAKVEAMNNTAAGGPSLHDAILDQYRMLGMDAHLLPLAEQVAFNLDDNGYLKATLDQVVEPLADRYTIADAEKVLAAIQTLEPRGVGARSQQECLLLQLDPAHPDHALQRRIIGSHFEDLSKNRLPRIAEALGVPVERIKTVLAGLSHLTTRPAIRRPDERNRYINPDVIVEWNGQDYDVRLAHEYLPELRLAPEWKMALRATEAGKDYQDYVRKKVESARAFLLAVEKRQRTLTDVAKAIVRHQRDFFDFGPHHLHPLKMQQVAADLHIHVSTVSRAASGKYMQTHRGIFPLRDFFTGGTQAVNGDVESRQSVRQKVKEIVEKEAKAEPLSDDEIVNRLLRMHGVKVARRTVTKYRKALGIASSRQRRAF